MNYLAILTTKEGRMLKREETEGQGSERQGRMVDSVLAKDPPLPCFAM